MIKNKFMGKIKKAFNYFFTTLGAIFFILILASVIIIVKYPVAVKTLTNKASLSETMTSPSNDIIGSEGSNPLLTPEQEKTLESVGIDPDTLPTTITPEMEECFNEKLGKERVDEIVAGAEPGVMDAIKAGSCLK